MLSTYQKIFLLILAILEFNKKSMNKFIVLIIIFGFCNFQCNKDTVVDSSGLIIKLNPLWSSSTSDGKIAASGLIGNTVFYDNGILVGGSQYNSNSLIMLDINSGSKKWTWQDYPTKTGYTLLDFPLILGNNMICNEYYFNINVDLRTGKTVWKNFFNGYSYDRLNNIFNGTVYCGNGGINNLGKKSVGAYVLDMQTGTPRFILSVKIDSTDALADTGYSGGASCVYPFVYNLDTLISIVVTDPPISGYKFRLTTCLYNMSKHTWVYERAPLFNASKGGVNGKPVVLGNSMYVCSGEGMACFDMLTGINKWTSNFSDGGGPSGFLTSSPLIADGKIFVQNENSYLYCLDPKSGILIWRQGIFGTCSQMSYLNGVVYFVCGGDGKLYAIDAANGNKLWAIPSPDLKTNSGASFDRYVGLVPPQNGQKGKIVVTTGLNAYCYEAYK